MPPGYRVVDHDIAMAVATAETIFATAEAKSHQLPALASETAAATGLQKKKNGKTAPDQPVTETENAKRAFSPGGRIVV